MYINFDRSRPLDLVLFGRATVDLNPIDYFHPLQDCVSFKKYLGGSPANIAVGLARLGKKAGFVGAVSDDQFGTFITDTFQKEGVDTSQMVRTVHGEKLGLTFTEILNEHESSILMYRNQAADLSLSTEHIHEDYIQSAKAILISGTALAQSPSREAMLKAVTLAKKTDTPVIFDIDYRPYNWKSEDETALYYSIVAHESAIILGSREEYDLTERLIEQNRIDAQTAAYWHKQKAKIVVIKHGKKGSTAYTQDGKDFSIKPFPIKALKSFGGGDGYASAFLFGLFNGWDMIECLEFGSASASLLVASHGCSADMPSEEKVRQFIKECKAQYGEMVAREV